jgi:hypothetical protein
MRLALFLVAVMAVSLVAANAAPKHPKRLHAGIARPATHDPCADPDAVCSAGTYVGRDPDPQVRTQMLWDFQAGLGNN